MTRQVTGTIALAEGATAYFVLCDRYERSLSLAPVTCIVGAGGIFSVVLNVTDAQQCYTVMTDVGKAVLWVYEGTAAQTVDLTTTRYHRNSIETFEHAVLDESAHNAAILIQKLLCKVPLVNEEEQRFMCRYENYAAGEEDKEMCAIDTALGGIYG